MAYSDKVLDHYNNPKNVGTLDKTKNNVGTGLVGAPECGDVMRLQIEVDNDGKITDAKFKTFGCMVSNTPINTPERIKKVSDIIIGDEVLTWNGAMIVSNKVKSIVKKNIPIDDILCVTLRESSRNNISPLPIKLLVSKDHIFWGSDNKPIEAENLKPGIELFEITENELRKITNIRHNVDFRKKLSDRMIKFNKILDHSSLPQNSKGYVHGIDFRNKISNASKLMWQNEEYVENWKKGMSNIDWSKPTSVENKFQLLFNEYQIPAKYSAGKIWIQTKFGPKSPDFVIPGKKKVIEVYTSKMPQCMEDRSDSSGWVEKKINEYNSAGYEVICLDVEKINSCLLELEKFVHNGMEVIEVRKIRNKNELRGCQRYGKDVVMYDLELEEGSNVFFMGRVGSHNCGSAIASSSLATEWLKGKSIDEAIKIDNMDIVEELNLPPVKIHCSVLAEDAIKMAINDYRKKNGLEEIKFDDSIIH